MASSFARVARTGLSWSLVLGAGCFFPDLTFPAGATDATTDVVELGDAGDASTVCPQPAAGLLVYYPFDETSGTVAHDCSGNGHDGTVTSPTWVAGHRGGALAFDGMSTFVDIAPNLLSAEPFTVSVWLNVVDYGTNAQYVVSKTQGAPYTSGWRFATASGESFSLRLGTDSGAFDWTSGGNDPLTTWMHVALVVDVGVPPQVWIAGVPFTTDASAIFLDDTNADARLGSSHGSSYFNGSMDEVRIYDHALSAAEIMTLASE